MEIKLIQTRETTHKMNDFRGVQNIYELEHYYFFEELIKDGNGCTTDARYYCRTKTESHYPDIIFTSETNGTYKCSIGFWSSRIEYTAIGDHIAMIEDVKKVIDTLINTFDLSVLEG